jgi:thioredoxin 1
MVRLSQAGVASAATKRKDAGMSFESEYSTAAPDRAAVDRMQGPVVLEFGAPGCGYCISAQPLIEASFTRFADVAHIKIEDGRGRPLGRSFRVKLWPTLVFMRDGVEVARMVRPTDGAALGQMLERISTMEMPEDPLATPPRQAAPARPGARH